MLRSYIPMRRQSKKVRNGADEWRAVYRQVDERSGGFCEVVVDAERCKKRAADHHHLNKPRRAHHTPAGIVHMCRAHHDRCEWPYKRGRLVYVGASFLGVHFVVKYANDKWQIRRQETT